MVQWLWPNMSPTGEGMLPFHAPWRRRCLYNVEVLSEFRQGLRKLEVREESTAVTSLSELSYQCELCMSATVPASVYLCVTVHICVGTGIGRGANDDRF